MTRAILVLVAVLGGCSASLGDPGEGMTHPVVPNDPREPAQPNEPEPFTPGDLAAGRTIAGTGTIAPGGEVGPIGGIEEKVIAAERIDAEVLLVPTGDFAAARRTAPEDLELVEVATFDDAIDYLFDSGGTARAADAA